jgi:hypothetical protein
VKPHVSIKTRFSSRWRIPKQTNSPGNCQRLFIFGAKFFLVRRLTTSISFTFIGLLAGIYLLRLLMTQTMGIMPQDAYYYFYSEELALSYFDHPPMVAYMLYLFTSLLGKSVGVIKLADFLVSMGTLAIFYALARNFLSGRQAVLATVWLATTLLLTVVSVNTTPDVPLLFFWTLALWVLTKAVFEQRSLYWLLSGLLMGLAFMSKYTALLLPAGLGLFLLLSTTYRKEWWGWRFWGALFFCALGMLPVIWWNFDNDWMSFRFQSAERAEEITAFRLHPALFLGNLGTQLLLLLPPLFGGMCWVAYKMLRKYVKNWHLPHDRQLFLWCFSLPIIGFFFGVSLFYWVKLNWMMPGYLTALILVTPYLSKRLLRVQLYVALALHVVILLQLTLYPVPIRSDDTWYAWEVLAEEVEDLQARYPDHFVFSNDIYKTSAVLDFYLEEPVYAGNVIGEAGFEYRVRYPDLGFLEGRNALYFDSDKRARDTLRLTKSLPKLEDHFAEIHQLDPILIYDYYGRLVRKFWVFECLDYRTN